MQNVCRCLLSISLVAPVVSYGGSFDIFGRQNDLKMSVIVDVGDAEKIDAPFGKLGARETIKVNGRCFEPLGLMGLWGLGRKAAFVLVDQAKSTKIALFDTGIGSIKVDVFLVTQVDCSVSGSSEMPNDPEKALEMLKKKQEILQKELERLKNRK